MFDEVRASSANIVSACFITVSPEDSFLLGRGINGDGFRRFDACEIHPMSFPS